MIGSRLIVVFLILLSVLGCESSEQALKPPSNPSSPNNPRDTSGGDTDTDTDTDSDVDGDADSDGDADLFDTGTDNPCLGPNPPENCALVPSGPACGDGEINQAGEVCDDGNTLPGDGCTGICLLEPHYECPAPGQPCVFVLECGNGIVEAGEVCDDGNKMDDDGCNATCEEQSANYICPVPGQPCEKVVFCGDGRINGEETCEDGNTTPNDGCDADCNTETGWICPVPGQPCEPGPRCGDSTLSVAIDEACDDGNLDNGDGCDATCQIESGYVCPVPGEPCQNTTRCGDGRVSGAETCDDANEDPDDGCDACVLQPGYECPFPGAKCLADCGDGILFDFLGEECDDGNESDGDGCTSTCEWEDGFVCEGQPGSYTCRETVCGDGVIEGTEGCDDGNNNMGDGCTPSCMLEPICEGGACTSTCGDGLVLESMNEACDDGNVNNDDGCSADCQIEEGYECKQPPLGETMEVPIVYRDFPDDHPDFENGVVGQLESTPNMVRETLDEDGKPVYVGATGFGHVSSADTFADWFRDIPSNATVASMLVLYDNGQGGYVNRWGPDGEPYPYYSDAVWCGAGGSECSSCDEDEYDVCLDPCTYWGNGNTDACGVQAVMMDGNPLFFPLEDTTVSLSPAGPLMAAKVPPPYADSWPYEDTETGPLRNFSFTSEVRYWFEYNVDQTYTLDFLGDDDVWVFVNNRLAVDIGGIHTPVEGNLTLADAADGAQYGMEDGNVYEVVVFQAERQTDCSSYKLTLSGFNAAESDCGPICGDGVMSPGEQCDDGENAGGYNACQPDCTRGPYCGDAIVQEEFEACDDGLNISAYGTESTGCSPGCIRPPTCGDGIVQGEFGEVCDDGVNDGSYGGCSPDCHGAPWCGDAVVNGDEICDDGLNDGSYGNCGPDCVPGPRCGDTIVQYEFGETCDDGNAEAHDGCSPNCRDEGGCGDAIVDREAGEQCDDGVNDGGYGECAPLCLLGPHCGDGVVNGPEVCDDGVNGGGYGECAPGCILGPHCGDGLVQPPYEECDDANENDLDECSNACKEVLVMVV